MGEHDVTNGAEIRVVGAERPEGLELRTLGLAAHGVPELRISGLAPYLGQGWARVLAELARLLAVRAAVGEDLHRGGVLETVDLGTGTDVEVVLRPDGGDLVPVSPSHSMTEEEWRRDVVLSLFPSAHT